MNTGKSFESRYARSLIEASHDPLFTVSPLGKITDVNHAAVLVTGVTREKLIESDFFEYFTDPVKAREAYRNVFDHGFVVDFPLTIKDHMSTDVLFNGSVYRDEDGDVLGVVIVARDFTERKKIENELVEARLFAEMATELAQIANAKAEAATLIAEEAVSAKQQFLSNMSHEIRTPMNAIIGFTKVVLKTELSAKQREYLTAIKMSGDSLIVLINDILDLAKVDSGKMEFEQNAFKLSASLSAMLHLFEMKIQEKNLELIIVIDINIPEVLVGDPVRLHQIIMNLVSNAVKFTSKGKISVEAKLLNEDERTATVEFSVTDTGIGIVKEKQGKIFDNFQQASSKTSRLYGGTGLGLAIVKQLVEGQGGNINVKSELDLGSRFSFALTFLKTNERVNIESEFVIANGESKDIKVLVVEDIALNQLLMKTLLDDFGFQCDIAVNGRVAIEKLEDDEYDIVLMDLQMPEMNGFEATKYIRETLKSDIPIIALTADVTTVDLAKCKLVGMNDYIAKPVDEQLLYAKIMSLAKRTDRNTLVENNSIQSVNSVKSVNLEYLSRRTKSDPKLMMEMISLYLTQTPPLVDSMKSSLESKDWTSLHAAVHKMIPSFAIMGISKDYEDIARKIQVFATAQEESEGIAEMVLQIESVCARAYIELKEELKLLNKTN